MHRSGTLEKAQCLSGSQLPHIKTRKLVQSVSKAVVFNWGRFSTPPTPGTFASVWRYSDCQDQRALLASRE